MKDQWGILRCFRKVHDEGMKGAKFVPIPKFEIEKLMEAEGLPTDADDFEPTAEQSQRFTEKMIQLIEKHKDWKPEDGEPLP